MSFYTKDINSDMFVNTFSFKFIYKSLSLSIIFSLSILSSCSLGVVVLVAQSGPTLCNPWTVACRAPLSMGFSRQEYRSGLPFPSPGDLPDPGIEPRSPALQADALTSEPPGKPNTEPLAKIHEPYSSTMKTKNGQSALWFLCLF